MRPCRRRGHGEGKERVIELTIEYTQKQYNTGMGRAERNRSHGLKLGSREESERRRKRRRKHEVEKLRRGRSTVAERGENREGGERGRGGARGSQNVGEWGKRRELVIGTYMRSNRNGYQRGTRPGKACNYPHTTSWAMKLQHRSIRVSASHSKARFPLDIRITPAFIETRSGSLIIL